MVTDRSLLIGLVHRTKGILGSVEQLAHFSREKFSDKEFGESFYKELASNIEKIELLMNGFLNYIKSTTPIMKENTVNTLIDEVVKRHQAAMEERKIKISKRIEKPLPETIVPDEQMTFILDSVLQYAAASMPFGGIIEFHTKSFSPLKAMGEERPRNIEIMVTFTDYQKPAEEPVQELGSMLPKKEEGLDLLLQLVYVIAQENQGKMEYEPGERKGKSSIVLTFRADRRKTARYEPVYE